MRTFKVNNTNLGVRCTITTNDLITPAYGRNFINIEIDSNSQVKPSVINIVLFNENEEIFTYFVLNNKCHISLDWLKYFAPKSGTRNIYLDLCINNDIEINKSFCGVEFELTAGYGEVDISGVNFHGAFQCEAHKLSEVVQWSATQITPHWNKFEFFILIPELNAGEFIYKGDFDDYTADDDYRAVGFYSGSTQEEWGETFGAFDQGGEFVLFAKIPTKNNLCCDIEIRITNRYGLRGVIGGKIIDVSEGGDDVKSNFNNYTLPYNGIYQHQKIGQKIQKEVGFDCGGDFGLLELLRDACVYGACEWYDNVTGQWLPCQVVDNSLDTTDAFKEQSITFILQEL